MSTNENTANEIIEELEAENARLRAIICALLHDAIDPMGYMRKKDIKETIAIVAENNKELTK